MSAAKKAGTVTRGAPAPAPAAVGATQTLPASPRPSTTAAPAPGAPGAAGAQGAPSAPAGAAAPGAARSAARPAPGRKVRLTVSRVDPWSAMKLAFLIAVALGIAFVVMTAVLWMVLAGMNVFDQVNGVVQNLATNPNGGATFNILDYVGFGRVVSLSIVIAVIDVVLLTAVSTIGAFIYNVSANLVGGLQLTLTDD